MKIENIELRNNGKFSHAVEQIFLRSQALVEFMDLYNDSENVIPDNYESGFMEFQFAEIQKNLTRAKKSLREIIDHNKNKNKNEE